MDTLFQHQLKDEFDHYGFPLTSDQVEQLTMYRSELKRWNKHINLTAVNDDTKIIYKHFLDSLSVLEHYMIEPRHNVIDVGTGAGFPGVVLKIYNPEIQLTLVEVSQKKVAFLKYLISQLGFNPDTKVYAIRAEEFARKNNIIHSYDWVLTRYVASLAKSASYCIPLLNPTGKWIAYKSFGIDDEIQQSVNTIRKHNGRIAAIHKSKITQLNRSFIVVNPLNIDEIEKNNLIYTK